MAFDYINLLIKDEILYVKILERYFEEKKHNRKITKIDIVERLLRKGLENEK